MRCRGGAGTGCECCRRRSSLQVTWQKNFTCLLPVEFPLLHTAPSGGSFQITRIISTTFSNAAPAVNADWTGNSRGMERSETFLFPSLRGEKPVEKLRSGGGAKNQLNFQHNRGIYFFPISVWMLDDESGRPVAALCTQTNTEHGLLRLIVADHVHRPIRLHN